MKLLAALSVCVACSAGAVVSNAHLVPTGGVLTAPPEDIYPASYHQSLRRLLHAEVPFTLSDPVLDVYVLPSWGGESLLTLDNIGKGPCTKAAVSKLESSLYSAMDGKKSFPSVSTVVGCVSTNLVCEATEVIYNALVQTRYPDPPEHGADGTTFVYLGFVLGFGVIEGKTWSPDKGHAMYNLVQLSNALESLVRNPTDSDATARAYVSIDLLRKQVPAMKANQPLHPDAACGRAGERRR